MSLTVIWGRNAAFRQFPRSCQKVDSYGRPSNIIDYRYANYDIAAVEADYEKTADELSRAQLALDAVNGRETFEFGE